MVSLWAHRRGVSKPKVWGFYTCGAFVALLHSSIVTRSLMLVAARFWLLLRLILQLKHDGDVVRWRLVALVVSKVC